jgi:glutamyl-Q tRNA(Asp) synthetase
VLQSQRGEAYQAALERLDAAGLLYPCTCSRKTLAALPRAASESAPYPGICRAAKRGRREPHSLRVLATDAEVLLEDRLQGTRHWNLAREFGDFIVFRRDRVVAYHLATVVDDAEAGVTEVLRGCDLLASTPLQIHLQRLLGLPTPDYCHVPVVVDRYGVKLSKQNLAEAVDGKDPSATLCALLRLLRHPPPPELCQAPPTEILAWAAAAWDLSRLPKTALPAPA